MTAPAPLAWDPTSMSEMVFAPNPSPRYTETPSRTHLVTVACTPLRRSQGPVAEESVVDSSQGTVISYQTADAMHILQDDIDRSPPHRKPKIGPGRSRRGTAKRQPYSKEKRLQTKKARDFGICIQCRHVLKPVSRVCVIIWRNLMVFQHPIQTTPSANASAARRRPSTCFDYLVFVTRLTIAFFSALFRICPTRALSQWSVEIMVHSISQRPGSTPRSKRYSSLRIGAQFSRLPVRRFEPPKDDVKDDKGFGGKGRRLFAIPWAMTDAATGLKAINAFINESAICYVDHIVPRDDVLLRVVFEVARRFAADRTYVRLPCEPLFLCNFAKLSY